MDQCVYMNQFFQTMGLIRTAFMGLILLILVDHPPPTKKRRPEMKKTHTNNIKNAILEMEDVVNDFNVEKMTVKAYYIVPIVEKMVLELQKRLAISVNNMNKSLKALDQLSKHHHTRTSHPYLTIGEHRALLQLNKQFNNLTTNFSEKILDFEEWKESRKII